MAVSKPGPQCTVIHLRCMAANSAASGLDGSSVARARRSCTLMASSSSSLASHSSRVRFIMRSLEASMASLP